MGCGSSSLKGEKVNTVNSEPPDQPIKKVQTNFSDIDFTGDGSGTRRGKSFAVAPDEHRRPTRVSEIANEDAIPELPHQAAVGPDGEKLAPYRTIDGDDGLASPGTTHVPQLNLPTSEPTTSTSNQDPALVYSSSLSPHNGTGHGHESKEERTQSWYARAQSRLSSSNRNNSQISDEDLMRVFGMTRQQWNAYCNDPKNGVGAHARPGDLPIMGSANLGTF